MKVVIMAAGKGTRMLPLTKNVPKVLVEVNGKPFLSYVLKNLKEAGFTEFGIIVGHLKEKISEFIEVNGIKATLIEQKEQKGTGHALLQARAFCGEDDFIVLGGDNLWTVNDFKKFKVEDKFNYISGFKINPPYDKYGILQVEDDYLVKVVEKPKEFVGDLVNAALYKFKPEIWGVLENVKFSSRGEIELTDAVNVLAKEKKVKVIEAEMWVDLGCKEDIVKVEKFLIEKHI
jgi:dTDP-glucose pyrophosphorylase